MSEGEIVFWIYFYQGLAILGMLAWCIGAVRDMRRERKLRKQIERIVGK